MPDGNEAAVRKVANQLFEIWDEQQAKKRGLLAGSLPAWVACVLSITGVVWSAAILTGEVAEHTRRIERIEAEQQRAANDSRQVLERMARIEAKLDLILGERM